VAAVRRQRRGRAWRAGSSIMIGTIGAPAATAQRTETSRFCIGLDDSERPAGES
jgi:hypothetical protein